jgi:EmrB/QacA subfamily drug resistance transporter
MDSTIVNVALPSIRRGFHASTSALQWSIDGYTVVVASFLMLAGSSGDRFGRRRVFQTGLALFGLGSLLCSLAPTIQLLVGARVVQALGGSMLSPVAMSIIANVFTDAKERARAIGIWGAMFGVSMALGPVVGGALTQTLGWRACFWVNLPICAAAIVATARFVPESRAPNVRAFDPIGQALVMLALATVTFSIIEGPHQGWTSPLILGGFSVFAISAVALAIVESRRREPLIDLRFFKSATFSSATILAVLGFSAFAAFLFLNALYLQEVRDFSAIEAGVATLPLAVSVMIFAPLSGRLVARGWTRASLVGAGIGLALSSLALIHLAATTSLPWLLGAYALFGTGFGLINSPITNSAIAGMPRAQAGVAAAVASTSRQVGVSLGVAIGGSIAGARMAGGLDLATASHPVWYLACGCGVAVAVLGFLATSAWARRTADSVASLLGD